MARRGPDEPVAALQVLPGITADPPRFEAYVLVKGWERRVVDLCRLEVADCG